MEPIEVAHILRANSVSCCQQVTSERKRHESTLFCVQWKSWYLPNRGMDMQTIHHNERRNQIRLVSIRTSAKWIQCRCVYARKISYKCLNYTFHFKHRLWLYETRHDLMVFLRWCCRKGLDTNKISSMQRSQTNVRYTVPVAHSNHAENPNQTYELDLVFSYCSRANSSYFGIVFPVAVVE